MELHCFVRGNHKCDPFGFFFIFFLFIFMIFALLIPFWVSIKFKPNLCARRDTATTITMREEDTGWELFSFCVL